MTRHTVVPPPRERRILRCRPGKIEVGPLMPLEGLVGELVHRCEKGNESLEGVADDGERMYAEPPLCFLMWCRVRGAMSACLSICRPSRLPWPACPTAQCSEARLPDGIGWMYAEMAHPYAAVCMHALFDVVDMAVAIACGKADGRKTKLSSTLKRPRK